MVFAFQNGRQGLVVHVAVILAVGCILVLGFMGLQHDPWMDDDPGILAYALSYTPYEHFFHREVIVSFTRGGSLQPVLACSFWLDGALGIIDPRLSYFHVASLFLVTAISGYFLLRRLWDPSLALGITLLWLLLPSTVSVVEFLSTRHYMLGLTFTIWAALACHHSMEVKGRRQWGWVAAAQLFCMMAALSKELYVTGAYWLLLCLYLQRRHWAGIGATIAGAGAYTAYRLWAIGLVPRGFGSESYVYDIDYGDFLLRLPQLFSNNELGYALFVVLAALIFKAVWLRVWRPGACLFWGGILVTALLTIYPVSIHLHHAFEHPGTWYRILFFWNTLILVLTGYLSLKVSKELRALLAIVFMVPILLGMGKTLSAWQDLKQPYGREAAFYLNEPDKLLYSEVPAYWFLSGIHQLYKLERGFHFLHPADPSPQTLDILREHKTVYRWNERSFQSMPHLRRKIWVNFKKAAPLDQAITASEAADVPRILGDDGTFELVIEGSQLRFAEADQTWTLPKSSIEGVLYFPKQELARHILMVGSSWPTQVRLFDLSTQTRSVTTLTLPGDLLHPWVGGAWVRFEADSPLQVMAFTRAGNSAWRHDPALLLQPDGQGFFPHVPHHKHWQSKIVAFNPGLSSARVHGRFYFTHGDREKQLYSVGAGREEVFMLDPGVAAVGLEWDQPLYLAQVLDWVDTENWAVVPHPKRLDHTQSFAMDETSLWRGIAVFNPNDVAISFPYDKGVSRVEPHSRLLLSDPPSILQISADGEFAALALWQSRDGRLCTDVTPTTPSGRP